MLMGAAPLAAFGLVAFGIGWWEFRARRIHSADEVALGLGVRVVGAVPVSGRRQFATPLAATGAEDCRMLLDMLGLIDGEDGIPPVRR